MFKRIFIFIFLSLLFLPNLQQKYKLFRIEPLNENRRKIQKPPGNILKNLYLHGQNYSQDYEKYYNDHYGFRDLLVKIDSLIKFKVLGASSTPKVIIGKEGWLFITADDAIESYCAIYPFSQKELRQWKTLLEKRETWLKEKGIVYLFIISPNKHTVYPEFLPDYINPVNSKSRLDQLTEYLDPNSTFEIINLKNALLGGKRQKEIYYRTDSHWNRYGALLAADQIAKKLESNFQGIKNFELSDFKITKIKSQGGGTAQMLGLDNFLTETRYNFTPVDRCNFRKISSKKGPNKIERYRTNCSYALPIKAIIYHDSFIQALRPFLSLIFEETLYINTPFKFIDEGTIKKEKPKVVIQEIVERHLEKGVPNVFSE